MFTFFIVVVSLIQSGLTQYLAGTNPSLPNPTLEECTKQKIPTDFTSNYTAVYAQEIDRWCSNYDEILGCVDRSNSDYKSDFNEWYFGLMFDSALASNISTDMCNGWQDYAEQMTCVARSTRVSSFCMNVQTSHLSRILLQLYYKNQTDNPYADVNACLYANYTANCMTKHMKYCSDPIRHIINKYFTLLSGKCEEILFQNEQEHRNKTAAIMATRQKQAEKVKTLIPTPSQVDNTTTEPQPEIKSVLNNKIRIFKEKVTTTAVPNPVKTTKESKPETISLEAAGNITDILAMVDSFMNSTTTTKQKTKTRKKKTKKSKSERVKAELRKLLGMVLGSI